MDEMKTCPSCGVSKPSIDFRVGRNTCKACLSKQIREWRDSNKEHVKLYKHKYDESHPEQKTKRLKKLVLSHKKNRQTSLANQRKKREKLHESYIATSLLLGVSELTPEIVELKRQQLAHYRLLRELKTVITEKSKVNHGH